MVPLLPCLPPRVYCQHSSLYDPAKMQVGLCSSSACRILRNSILLKVKVEVLQRPMRPNIFRSDHIAFLSLIVPSIPATHTSLLRLKHPNQTRASGPLHLLLSLFGTLFPRYLYILPHFLQLLVPIESSSQKIPFIISTPLINGSVYPSSPILFFPITLFTL